MVERSKVLVLLLGLLGGPLAGASERLAVDVLSALEEPLLATLTLPPESPSAPLSLELQGALPLIVAEADEAREGLVYLRSKASIDAPIVQGTLRVGQGAEAQRYPFILFLDEPSSRPGLSVAPGTTLWRLADQWAGPPGSTRRQRVAALFYRNPEAFAEGDPDRLLAGATLRLPSPKAVLEGPPLTERPRLEVRPPAPSTTPSRPDALQIALEEERSALAAALARAEADRRAWEAESAAQAAQLAALTAQLERQQQALEAMQRAAELSRVEALAPEGRESVTPAPALGLLAGAALAGLAGLAGLGAMLRRRRQEGQAPAPPSPGPAAPAPGLRVYEPSALVQRFGAQSLLSQRDWTPVLDQVEMALAYGRLGEAEAALRAALEDDPHSVALRLQSLALAVEQGDRPRFEQEAASLARGADAALLAQLEALAERLPPPSRAPEAPGPDAAVQSPDAGLTLALEGEGLVSSPSGDGSPLRG